MPTGTRSYYDLLEVGRDADEKAIRSAYRKLARKYHPDVNPGDPEAADRFKEISEAYGVLSDPEKRQLYDRFGDQWQAAQRAKEQGIDIENLGGAFGGQGRRGFRFQEGDFGDLGGFEDLLGSLFGHEVDDFGRARVRQKGADVETEVLLDLEEVLKGVTRSVSVSHEEPCPMCQGTGQSMSGVCTRCRGAGVVQRQRRVDVKIPPGVREGSRIRAQGQGGAGRGGGASGDLYLRTRVRPHPFFQRSGSDLSCEVPVTFPEAVLGADIEVPTLTGKARVKVPPGTSSGQTLRLRGMGLPDPKTRQRGDQLVRILVTTPGPVEESQQDAIHRLEALYPANPRADLWKPHA